MSTRLVLRLEWRVSDETAVGGPFNGSLKMACVISVLDGANTSVIPPISKTGTSYPSYTLEIPASTFWFLGVMGTRKRGAMNKCILFFNNQPHVLVFQCNISNVSTCFHCVVRNQFDLYFF